MRLFKSFLLPLVLLSASCEALLPDGGDAIISVSFSSESYSVTKTTAAVPDTNDFFVTVTSSAGEKLFSGSYHSLPFELIVSAGTYTVEAVSSEFLKPAFDAPQWGDSRTVVVKAGEYASVPLSCRQLNAGVKLSVDSGFLTAYPSGVLWVRNEDGRLMYSMTEKRTAYFRPGAFSLVMTQGSDEQVLYSRTLEAAQMLNLNVSASAPSSGNAQQKPSQTGAGISIRIDTSRTWLSDKVAVGGGAAGEDGGSMDNAMTVTQALENIGAEGVWICGYVVGGDLTQSKVNFEPPFSSKTNLALAARSSVSDRDRCLSVALPSGAVRDAMNLVDNPGNYHRKVYVKGDVVESYYGIPGIKNIKEFRF